MKRPGRMEEIHFKEELEVTEYLADKKLEAIPCIVGNMKGGIKPGLGN